MWIYLLEAIVAFGIFGWIGLLIYLVYHIFKNID